MLKNIFWDFDGVILNSNEIRDIGFEKVLKEYPKVQVEELLAYHRVNGGLSRYVKFRYFYEIVRKEKVEDSRIMELADCFSVIMKDLLTNKSLLIDSTISFIENNFDKYDMHIMSGSDQNELRYLCENLGISKYFISILGSPVAKTKHVSDTIKKNNYAVEETIFIGDSINDYDAAKDNNILFMGFNNPELEKESNITLY